MTKHPKVTKVPLKEEGGVWAHSWRVQSHVLGREWWQLTWGSWSSYLYSQEAERGEYLCSVNSLFSSSVQDPSPWESAAHIQRGCLAHMFECLVHSWWDCLERIRRYGLCGGGVTEGKLFPQYLPCAQLLLQFGASFLIPYFPSVWAWYLRPKFKPLLTAFCHANRKVWKQDEFSFLGWPRPEAAFPDLPRGLSPEVFWSCQVEIYY